MARLDKHLNRQLPGTGLTGDSLSPTSPTIIVLEPKKETPQLTTTNSLPLASGPVHVVSATYIFAC